MRSDGGDATRWRAVAAQVTRARPRQAARSSDRPRLEMRGDRQGYRGCGGAPIGSQALFATIWRGPAPFSSMRAPGLRSPHTTIVAQQLVRTNVVRRLRAAMRMQLRNGSQWRCVRHGLGCAGAPSAPRLHRAADGARGVEAARARRKWAKRGERTMLRARSGNEETGSGETSNRASCRSRGDLTRRRIDFRDSGRGRSMRRQRGTVRPDPSHAARGGAARAPDASCPDAGGRARRAQAREPPQSLAQSTRLDPGYRSAGDVSASGHPGEYVPVLSARRTNVVCAAGQTTNAKSSKRLSDLEAHQGMPHVLR